MKSKIIEWLKNIKEQEGQAPIEVIAFNFGLLESENGFMIYIVGSLEYSEEDDDWACIDLPSTPSRYLRFPDKLQNETWEKILEYSVEILKELEKDGAFDDSFLCNAKAITTGFDDGELVKIR